MRKAALVAAVGVLLLIALGLRLHGLDGKSLWYDEAYSVFVARQSPAGILARLRAEDSHPPLHYLVLHYWTALYGAQEASVRLPSVLASLGAILLTFLLGRRLGGVRLGLGAAAVLALSPFQIVASQEARMYPLLTLFVAAGSYALWLALEEGRRRQWAGYAVLMALALYTHHFAALIVLAHGLYAAAFGRRAGLLAWLKWTGLAAVAYAPLAPLVLAQLASARGWPSFRPSFGVGALADLVGMLGFGGGLFGMGTYFRRGVLPLEYQGPILLPFLLLATAGATYLAGWRRRTFLLAYLLVPILVVAALSLRWNMFYERYFSFLLPPFALLLAAGVLYVVEGMPRPARRAAAAGLVALLLSFVGPGLVTTYRAKTPYDWRGLAHYVREKSHPDDFILYLPAFARIPFEYYYKALPEEQAPVQGRAQRSAGYSAENAPELFARIARGHPRMWVIATIPVGYEARLEIAGQLEPFFREVEGTSLGLVFAFLWESRVYGAAEDGGAPSGPPGALQAAHRVPPGSAR